MRYMTPPEYIHNRDEELDYAYIRDTEIKIDDLKSTRVTFIRIVRPESVDTETIHSFSVDDVMVDVDEAGNILGVTIIS